MAKKKTANPFDIFKQEVKTAHIESINATVQYKELTLKELDALNKSMVKGYDPVTNEPDLDMDAALMLKYKKVEMMLVEPTITVEELQEFTGDGQKFIKEMLALLAKVDNELVDEEGN